jgi:DNA mismatch repair ATPase MutS
LAGLPDLTVKRAEQVLKLLEDEKQNKMVATIENDLPLFEVLKNEVKKEEKNPIIEEIENLNLDNLTPFEALEKLYNLKKML